MLALLLPLALDDEFLGGMVLLVVVGRGCRVENREKVVGG